MRGTILKRNWKGGLAAAIMLLAAPAARSHHLLLEASDTRGLESPLPIPRPEISYAVYGRLESRGDVDFFSFRVDRPGPVHLGIFIPFRPEFADYYPTYALVGPGLAEPAVELPFALPAGVGAVVVRSDPVIPRPTFFEPFTFTRFYRGVVELDQNVPAAGTYYMAVWHERGEYGDYLVSYGTAEKWSLRDLVEAYRIVGQVKRGAWGSFRGRY